MCGLPPDLTYDEYTQLVLNQDRIKWRLVDVHVQAGRILQGGMPPLPYLEVVTGDTTRAREAYGDLMLTKMMNRVR